MFFCKLSGFTALDYQGVICEISMASPLDTIVIYNFKAIPKNTVLGVSLYLITKAADTIHP
jgi:hypothetical protein